MRDWASGWTEGPASARRLKFPPSVADPSGMSAQVPRHGRRFTPGRLLAGVVLALAVASPAGASAATAHGTVLLLNSHNRTVELVAAGDAVHAYRYGARFPAVAFGTELAFRAAGNHISHARTLARRASKVSFYARVTSSRAGGLTVSLAGGHHLSFGASRVHDAGSAPTVGQKVLLTVTRVGGGLSVSVASSGKRGPSGSHPGSGSKGGGSKGGGSKGGGPNAGSSGVPNPITGTHPIEPHSTVSGVITSIGIDSITFQLPDGSSFSPTVGAASLAYLSGDDDLSDCETANVAYSNGSSGPVIDSLTPTGVSTAPISESLGDTCADESDGSVDVVGTIATIGASTFTVDVPGSPAMAFSFDPTQNVLGGNFPGDVVDVTYTQNADGSLTASYVEYVEEYTTGTILAVNTDVGTLDVADAVTGQTDTFQESDADFSGLTVGETVGVDYYVAAGLPQADDVESLG
jgi:uncharacterized membrane protein YgcG